MAVMNVSEPKMLKVLGEEPVNTGLFRAPVQSILRQLALQLMVTVLLMGVKPDPPSKNTLSFASGGQAPPPPPLMVDQ